MRLLIINFLKTHPTIVRWVWNIAGYILKLMSLFVRKEDIVLFCSFGGRNFNDSPKALYEEILHRDEFKSWKLVWSFVNPESFNIERGEKIKVDTPKFFKALLKAKVWISNSGMTRGINYSQNGTVHVETWHGTPLKKIGGDEHQNTLGGKKRNTHSGTPDNKTIRCAQSTFDRDIFARIWNADKNAILLSDLPRNDELLHYTPEKIEKIKNALKIDSSKKVVLYTPTYREYLIDENKNTFLAPPMDLKKWEEKIGDKYVLLIRAHYAVSKALNIEENDFVKDVSSYASLNDLYAISDLMISDYSSTYFDYSILDRPMLCFAYDLEEYEEKRGLYLDIEKALPCRIDKNEDEVLDSILTLDYNKSSEASKAFHFKYAPFAGNASKTVVDKIISKLKS